MTSSEVQIANLLYRYAECIDSGDFVGASNLFTHAKFWVLGKIRTHLEVLDIWEKVIIRYEDGTPHTKHVVTNPIIEVDEAAGTATSRTYYTVLLGLEGQIDIVATGRYHDKFERVDGKWRWSFRDYSLLDHTGPNIGKHNRAIDLEAIRAGSN
jgi:hypothetical protein